ncbi:hypothetical protein ACIBO1_18500 [Micromonospora sp. NPDC049903]|uniref:hypothetical protein n=1 Tax=Micromonospora sp. NPDC049903 TaxID=3364276 RepID=UPI0037ABFBA5
MRRRTRSYGSARPTDPDPPEYGEHDSFLDPEVVADPAAPTGVGAAMLKVDLPPEATADADRSARWIVWRQDDNGNRYEVARTESRADAEDLVAVIKARGHKQYYWAAKASE